MTSPVKQSGPHRGFTLMEMLVVIGIIALLASALVFAMGTFRQGARAKATTATITKIQGLIQTRLDGFSQAFETSRANRFQANISRVQNQLSNQSIVGDTKRLATILTRKNLMIRFFPQSFAEAGLTAPSGHDPETESSEVLYYVLTQREVMGYSLVSADQFSASEVADTDGDGMKEFVDAWGHPLRFYRWSSRLIRPGTDGASADDMTAIATHHRNCTKVIMPQFSDSSMLTQDPDDPTGGLADLIGGGGLMFDHDDNNATPAISLQSKALFERYFHTLGTAHPFLLVSAGGDGDLGLHEPTDRPAPGTTTTTSYGYLARPLEAELTNIQTGVDSSLHDNISNRQAGGGN